MKPLDPQHIRFVTRHFGDLQGLRHAAAMLWCVPWCLDSLGRPWAIAGPLLTMVLILLRPFLVARAKAYYKARIGHVIVTPLLPAYQLSVFSPGGAISGIQQEGPSSGWIFVSVFSSGIALSIWMAHSLSLSTLAALCYLTFGTILIATWFTRREHRLSQLHWPIAGTLCLALSFYATAETRASSPGQFQNAISITGSLVVVCFLLDHRELMSTLGWPSTEP
jgi:hypothetical protein